MHTQVGTGQRDEQNTQKGVRQTIGTKKCTNRGGDEQEGGTEKCKWGTEKRMWKGGWRNSVSKLICYLSNNFHFLLREYLLATTE